MDSLITQLEGIASDLEGMQDRLTGAAGSLGMDQLALAARTSEKAIRSVAKKMSPSEQGMTRRLGRESVRRQLDRIRDNMRKK